MDFGLKQPIQEGAGLDDFNAQLFRVGNSQMLRVCGNTVVGLMLRELNNRVTLLRRISLSQPGRLPNTLKELEDVVAAIEKGDGETAARLCIEHVEKAANNVLLSMSMQMAAD